MQAWYHYVGGHYNIASFIREARELGVSRKAAPNVARSMEWGDRVVLLKYGTKGSAMAGNVFAFAEFRIERLTLPESVAAEVCEQLIAEGRAEFEGGGGGVVKRQCGSYVVAGTWVVNADISEIMDMAQATGKEVWVLVSGPLTKVYHPFVHISPPLPFTRSFMRLDDAEATFEPAGRTGWIENLESSDAQEVVAVREYHKRTRIKRQDVARQLALPTMAS